MALLQINDLVVRYGEIEALRGVSLTVDEGQVVTLLGANGAGKSTTLRSISGLIKPAAGEILFDGKPIAGLGPEAIVRLGISHVPEGRRVFPGLSVKENIMLGGSNRRVGKAELSREADERRKAADQIEMRARLQPCAFDDRRGRERRTTDNVSLFHRALQIRRNVRIDPLHLQRPNKPLRTGGIDIPHSNLGDRPNRTERICRKARNAARTGDQKL